MFTTLLFIFRVSNLIKGTIVGNGFLEGGQFGYQAVLGNQLEGAFLDSQSSWE